MYHQPILVDETALDELRRERRSTHDDLAVELALQLRQLLTDVTADEPCAVLDGLSSCEKTTFGVAFQTRANSRLGSVASGSASPVGQ